MDKIKQDMFDNIEKVGVSVTEKAMREVAQKIAKLNDAYLYGVMEEHELTEEEFRRFATWKYCPVKLSAQSNKEYMETYTITHNIEVVWREDFEDYLEQRRIKRENKMKFIEECK